MLPSTHTDTPEQSQPFSPFDPAIITTLENLIAPGGRARVSPYTESAQFQILFGDVPEPQRRHDSARRILEANEARIDALAQYWVNFSQQGKHFMQADYDSTDFRDMYLAYYCTTNVSKIQLSLLDLVRVAALKEAHLRVLDVGVGTGTTLLGLMDFFILWACVCDLYGASFPIQSLAFTGIDCSSGNLTYAKDMALAYATTLAQRAHGQASSPDPAESLLTHVEQWTGAACWHQHDLSQEPYQDEPVNLIFASNVLNELQRQQGSGGTHLKSLIANLPAGGAAIIIEPGAEKETRTLMAWRRQLIAGYPHIQPLGGCANDLSPEKLQACDCCWNARRESLHQTLLYARFRQTAAKYAEDKRALNNFENNLLSWSYALLQARDDAQLPAEINQITIETGQQWTKESPLHLAYIGSYRGKEKTVELSSSHKNGKIHETADEWIEFIKFCPAHYSGTRAVTLWRVNGAVIPPIRYGGRVTISAVTTTYPEGSTLLRLETTPETEVTVQEPPLTVSETFLPTYSDQTRRAVDMLSYHLFGFPAMRPFQHRILAHVLTGRSILGIAATGGGKSECYILPALLLPGITVVVSPLKSLMIDQYEQRIQKRYGFGDLSTYINGDVPFYERQRRLARLEQGYYKLIYVTPEQLERSYILNSLRRADQRIGIRYLALDEAHCISQWGHDFRPAYLNLVQRLRQESINPTCIALTATASPEVRHDLCEELRLDPRPVEQGGHVYIESSNRPELNFVVRVCRTTDEKVSHILDELRQLRRDNKHNKHPGAAIVFLSTTGGNPDNYEPKSNGREGRYSAGVTKFASYLERELNTRVAIYHGKMSDSDDSDNGGIEHDGTSDAQHNRSEKQSARPGVMKGRQRSTEQHAFIDGERDIMVATKGFGMGIDKPNIRLVIHRSPPGNLEAYAQEAGRAGRDGEQATVVLYYSPDRPKDPNETDDTSSKRYAERSDHDIQTFFLKDRYIRKEDVRVMYAFLKRVQRTIQGRLYFTNDEAIDFFEECTDNPALADLSEYYRWPDFEKREPNTNESEEHREILERGHAYKQKTQYIQRILDVLYRIRPDVGEHAPRVAMFEALRECGTQLKNPQVRKLDNIWGSNAYFGHLFREKLKGKAELQRLLARGDLIALAERLETPLSEVAQLVSDIKAAEQGPKQKPVLFDYWTIEAPRYGPAEGKENLEDWRDYAGAQRRASGKAYDRARKAGREHNGKCQETTLDDWFSWSEVNKPVGWEIVPGAALQRAGAFEGYVQAFMALHTERERNDWAAYNRLLSDYVGVHPDDGTINPSSPTRQCLRAVLLGYLKTYEVIEGESCYSCNRCVPDENFARYSLEQRKQVVVRLTAEMEQLLTDAETYSDALPAAVLIQDLLDAVQREQARGVSLVAYLQGWTGRLLQDTPHHRAALALRIQAMLHGITEVQPTDAVAMLQTLVTATADSELEQVAALVAEAQSYLADTLDFHRLCIKLAQRRERPADEISAWEQILRLLRQQPRVDRARLFDAHTALANLYSTTAPDDTQLAYHRIHAARSSPDTETATQFYQQVNTTWQWSQVDEEHRMLVDGKRPNLVPALFISWLQHEQNERAPLVADYMVNHSARWQAWELQDLAVLAACMPSGVLAACPALAAHILPHIDHPDSVVHYTRAALDGGWRFAPQDIAHIVSHTLEHPDRQVLLASLATDPDTHGATYQALRESFIPRDWDDMAWYIAQFGADMAEDRADVQLSRLEQGVPMLPRDTERLQAVATLENLAQRLFAEPDHAAQAHALWQAACIGVPSAAVSYAFMTLRSEKKYLAQFFKKLREEDHETLQAIYQAFKARFNPTSWSTIEHWIHQFPSEIAADAPAERMNLWRQALPLLPEGKGRVAALRLLRPETLCAEPACADEIHTTWQAACSMHAAVLVDYMQQCWTLSRAENYVLPFLAQVRQQDAAQMAARYQQLEPHITLQSWVEVCRWLAWFTPEIMQQSPEKRLRWVQQVIGLVPIEQRCETVQEHLEPLVADLFTHPILRLAARAVWQAVCPATPEEVVNILNWDTSADIDISHLWRFLESWLEHVPPHLLQPGETLRQILHHTMAHRSNDPDRNPTKCAWIITLLRQVRFDGVFLQEVWPIVQPALSHDAASIDAYIQLCDLPPEGQTFADGVLKTLRIQQPHIVYTLYASQRKKADSQQWNAQDLERWLCRFGPEVTTAPDAERNMLFRVGMQCLEALPDKAHIQTCFPTLSTYLCTYVLSDSRKHALLADLLKVYPVDALIACRTLCCKKGQTRLWQNALTNLAFENKEKMQAYIQHMLALPEHQAELSEDIEHLRNWNRQVLAELYEQIISSSRMKDETILPNVFTVFASEIRRDDTTRCFDLVSRLLEHAPPIDDNAQKRIWSVIQSLFTDLASVSDLHTICQQCLPRTPYLLERYLEHTLRAAQTQWLTYDFRQQIQLDHLPLLANIHQRMNRKEVLATWQTFDAWLTWFAPVLVNEPVEQRYVLLRQSRQLVSRQKDFTASQEQLIRHARALFPDDDTVAKAVTTWQQALGGDSTAIDRFLVAPQQSSTAPGGPDLLLDLLLAGGNIHLLSQVKQPVLLNARWHLATSMVAQIQDFLDKTRYVVGANVTIQHFHGLEQRFQAFCDPDGADMFSVAALQLRTWITPTWLTPLSLIVEVLINRGRVAAARRFANRYNTLTVGRERLTVNEYIRQMPKSVSVCDTPPSRDFYIIARHMLGQGSNPCEVELIYE